MSILKQLLDFNKTDFNENELEVIKAYFNIFLDRLMENDSSLIYMDIIPRPLEARAIFNTSDGKFYSETIEIQ